jgi:hypothetical protein
VWTFVLLLVVVAVGSYYAARFLLEGFPRWKRRFEDDQYVRPYGPDDDDVFLSEISRKKGPDDAS